MSDHDLPCYQIASLFVAFLLAMDIKGMKIFRVVYFLPSIIPTIAATMIWTRIFAQDGILNKSLSVIGIKGPAWLTDRNTALYALMIMGLWGVGNTIIIYLSGLQGVSEELKEAARVDGAKGWQIFLRSRFQ